MGRRFLHLASNRLFWRVGDPYVYPYFFDLSVEPDPPKVGLGEGVTHGAVGGVFGVAEVLAPPWVRHFELAEAQWLLPYVERLAAGGVVTETELVADFVARHGRPPEAVESAYA